MDASEAIGSLLVFLPPIQQVLSQRSSRDLVKKKDWKIIKNTEASLCTVKVYRIPLDMQNLV